MSINIVPDILRFKWAMANCYMVLLGLRTGQGACLYSNSRLLDCTCMLNGEQDDMNNTGRERERERKKEAGPLK